MQTRIRYLPIEVVVAGMVLGDTVTDNHLRALLPAGAVLTDENLHQMLAHQVEFVCIAEPEERSEEQIDRDHATIASRQESIFAGADLTAPHMAALYAQVLTYRRA